MTIRVALHHATTYRFEHPVTIHPHTVRLRPAPHSRTPITAYSLRITPENHFINWQQDPFGNYVARLVFPEPADELSIVVDLIADMTVVNPFDFFVEDYAEHVGFAYPTDLAEDLRPYLRRVPAETDTDPTQSDAVDAWIDARLRPLGVFDAGTRTVDFLVGVNQAVRDDVDYTVRMDPGVQSPAHTLAAALGSCRDSAWLLVSVLRRLGLAARFVSGYLVQLTADVAPLDGPAGPSADFTDLHAWAEVYLPGAGWIGLDSTSGLFAGEGHIPLSATPSPASAAPITGATDFVKVEFDFMNSVTRVHEDVRVTKPYTEAQWAAIDQLGEQVDQRLAAGDVRLTMGGEPTFVSAKDTSTPQWESDADGDEKRQLATRLSDLLRARWAPNGLTHHGQGKWYPGEPLPRWQIEIAWRTDNKPLWRNQSLLDDPWSEVADPDHFSAAAEPFVRTLAARLGVPDDFVLPGYEDIVDVLLNEARQPQGPRPEVDPDPAAAALIEPVHRKDLIDDLDKVVGSPKGWVVPVFVDPDGGGWATARWQPRRRALFLTPGTSPMGLRLPLDGLAWGEQPDIVRNADGDATRELPNGAGDVIPARVYPIAEARRTAVTLEVREGHLFVFLPPIDRLDDAFRLVAAVEDTAADLGVSVVLEGYPLPRDDRMRIIAVTPDPGVIEVNVHPTSNWADLRELTATLFDDARTAGLATEKFDLDGTHTGTGGGNHITLGGATPEDSPLLRRPDLLRSLITYWQHHPSLSYVFTGRFVGPTSQAPRVDEGLAATLYELEIALDQLTRISQDPEIDHDLPAVLADDRRFDETLQERVERQRRTAPWLTDRLLRHMLADLTGNTHRAELCIDKLYNPDRGTTGRLGLLEMRGFEMPPHPRMSLVQALLVRALIVRFWEEPYTGPLIRWGTRLHDRYLLPAFAAADLRAVVAELNQHLARHPGEMTFDEAWLEPFLEFRFPRLGEVDVGGVHLELRQAIEPWMVLGEEVSLTGTARYVDSSVERLQVAATGLIEGSHIVTCNGVPLPMTKANTVGWGVGGDATPSAKVAGVRFRAWAPPSSLHPSIGVQSPLQFDLVDPRQGHSLGGFTYHVVHPGGRNYDSYPVNAASAEARRASRFEENRTSGRVVTPRWPDPTSLLGQDPAEFPTTLDLRRP